MQYKKYIKVCNLGCTKHLQNYVSLSSKCSLNLRVQERTQFSGFEYWVGSKELILQTETLSGDVLHSPRIKSPIIPMSLEVVGIKAPLGRQRVTTVS